MFSPYGWAGLQKVTLQLWRKCLLITIKPNVIFLEVSWFLDLRFVLLLLLKLYTSNWSCGVRENLHCHSNTSWRNGKLIFKILKAPKIKHTFVFPPNQLWAAEHDSSRIITGNKLKQCGKKWFAPDFYLFYPLLQRSVMWSSKVYHTCLIINNNDFKWVSLQEVSPLHVSSQECWLW